MPPKRDGADASPQRQGRSMTKRSLKPILEQTMQLHAELFDLWRDLPDPACHRALLVTGYCEIVRHHAVSQAILADAGMDVSATTLVRPAFEAMVRAVWCAGGASDEWIRKFLSPNPEALHSDAETEMGPNVGKMLDEIRPHHPAHIHQQLMGLKKSTWRAMHSYVHGGIRPLAQGLSPFPEHEVAGVVMNANGMLLTATNLLRMSRGVRSPQLPKLQKKYAACLPPADFDTTA
ncbi:MAG: DUF6988 family protein [Pseudomonadota bacterium]